MQRGSVTLRVKVILSHTSGNTSVGRRERGKKTAADWRFDKVTWALSQIFWSREKIFISPPSLWAQLPDPPKTDDRFFHCIQSPNPWNPWRKLKCFQVKLLVQVWPNQMFPHKRRDCVWNALYIVPFMASSLTLHNTNILVKLTKNSFWVRYFRCFRQCCNEEHSNKSKSQPTELLENQ